MDALRIGIFSLFTAASDLYADLSGRLYFGSAPEGVGVPYGIFFFVSDVNDDAFAKQEKEVYVQFSLFSGDSSPAAILKMDLDLTAMFKDKTFSVTGWTVINMKRVQGSGPIYNPADVEAGTGFYWQTDVDFIVSIEA
jgi:CRISPR/Cas system-associated endoribonuclease Cas2